MDCSLLITLKDILQHSSKFPKEHCKVSGGMTGCYFPDVPIVNLLDKHLLSTPEGPGPAPRACEYSHRGAVQRCLSLAKPQREAAQNDMASRKCQLASMVSRVKIG